MAETFYGPWRIVLVSANSHFAQRMLISGSDAADGGYDIAFGRVVDVAASGARWQLQTQFFPFGGPDWEPGDMRRTTRFEVQNGLIVQIDGAARPPGTGTTFANLTLMCTCLDPETNPIPAPNPYDFTIPGEG